MAELSFTNKKFVVSLLAAVVVLFGGIAVAIGAHNDKPAKTQGAVHAQNTAKKQDTPAANVLGASTDTPSDTPDGDSNEVPNYTPLKKNAPSVVASSSNNSTPTNNVPPVSDTTDGQTGGKGAGDQTGGSDPTDNTPPAQPSYHLTFHPELAYAYQETPFPGQELPAGLTHYAIPFDIVYDDGFVPDSSQFSWPDCQFLATPADDYNVLCLVSQKKNELVIQYDDTSVAGHYVVEMTYPINGQNQAAAVEFDLE